MASEKEATTIEMEKKLLLQFKSMCVLKETTMSHEIESLVRDWVSKNKDITVMQ